MGVEDAPKWVECQWYPTTSRVSGIGQRERPTAGLGTHEMHAGSKYLQGGPDDDTF